MESRSLTFVVEACGSMKLQRNECDQIEFDGAEWVGHGEKDGHRVVRVSLRKSGRLKAFIGLSPKSVEGSIRRLRKWMRWAKENLHE